MAVHWASAPELQLVDLLIATDARAGLDRVLVEGFGAGGVGGWEGCWEFFGGFSFVGRMIVGH